MQQRASATLYSQPPPCKAAIDDYLYFNSNDILFLRNTFGRLAHERSCVWVACKSFRRDGLTLMRFGHDGDQRGRRLPRLPITEFAARIMHLQRSILLKFSRARFCHRVYSHYLGIVDPFPKQVDLGHAYKCIVALEEIHIRGHAEHTV